jgi:Ca-activated chloride channel family protein
MTLLWPGVLFLLISIPILILVYIWILRRRRRFALRYSSLSLIRAALPRHSWMRRHLPFILFLVALTTLVVALSRPASYVRLPANEATIILAIDTSRSMRQRDIFPSRLEAAQDAALQFVRTQAQGTQIGIVAFSGYAEMVQMPTTDQESLRVAIESLTLGRGTGIGRGILRAIDMISTVDDSIQPSAVIDDSASPEMIPQTSGPPGGVYAPAIVVLLTDGVNTTGPGPIEAAQEAVVRGIRTYTIGFGTVNPEEIPQNSGDSNSGQSSDSQATGGWFRRGLDEDTLRMVAAMTGGEYFAAESARELEAVFQSLPTNLITRVETTEITVFFAAAGALLAALAIGLGLFWRPLP